MSLSKPAKTVTLQQTLRESWPTILVVSASSIFCITYALLQKKFFSREDNKGSDKILFSTDLACCYFIRKYLKKGSYWSTVDATVFLGAVPLEGCIFLTSESSQVWRAGRREYAGRVCRTG